MRIDFSKQENKGLLYDGKVSIKVNGPRRYSVDLIQGGLELPAEFTFQTSNEKLFTQLQ